MPLKVPIKKKKKTNQNRQLTIHIYFSKNCFAFLIAFFNCI